MRKRRGQSVFEYVALIGTGIVLVTLILLLLRGSIFGPQEKEITNQSQQFYNLTQCLKPGYFNCTYCPDDKCQAGTICNLHGTACEAGPSQPFTCTLSANPNSGTGTFTSTISAVFNNKPSSVTSGVMKCTAISSPQTVNIPGNTATLPCIYGPVLQHTVYTASASAGSASTGIASCSATVAVDPGSPQPSCSLLSAVPSTIVGSGTSTISVAYSNVQNPTLAVACGNGGTASGTTCTSTTCSGTCSYAPASYPQTYTATASLGTLQCAGSATVTLTQPPQPSCSVTANPTDIPVSESSTITITYANLPSLPQQINCGNGQTIQVSCSGTSGSCSGACTYSNAQQYTITIPNVPTCPSATVTAHTQSCSMTMLTNPVTGGGNSVAKVLYEYLHLTSASVTCKPSATPVAATCSPTNNYCEATCAYTAPPSPTTYPVSAVVNYSVGGGGTGQTTCQSSVTVNPAPSCTLALVPVATTIPLPASRSATITYSYMSTPVPSATINCGSGVNGTMTCPNPSTSGTCTSTCSYTTANIPPFTTQVSASVNGVQCTPQFPLTLYSRICVGPLVHNEQASICGYVSGLGMCLACTGQGCTSTTCSGAVSCDACPITISAPSNGYYACYVSCAPT